MKNNADILAGIYDRLPDRCGNGTVEVTFLRRDAEGKVVDNQYEMRASLSFVCLENVWDTVDAVAKYLDETVPGYNCAKQSAQFRAKQWIRPALWAGNIIVTWD